LYGSELVKALKTARSHILSFGGAGAKMIDAGVEPVVSASRLAVVGLVEVVRHIPGIYRDFRKLIAAARKRRPDLAILTDSPDFSLRVVRKLKRMRLPVLYLVPLQVWA
jgi:lipid-A-disaccharide synthase